MTFHGESPKLSTARKKPKKAYSFRVSRAAGFINEQTGKRIECTVDGDDAQSLLCIGENAEIFIQLEDEQLEEKVQQIIGIVGKIADIDRMLVHQIAGVFCKEARVPTGFEINVIGNIELCGK